MEIRIPLTDAQAIRINAALVRMYRDDDEFAEMTPMQRYRHWLNATHRNLVTGQERQQAAASVAADLDITVEELP